MRVMPRFSMEPTTTPMEAMPRWGMGPKDNPDAGDARPNMEPTATLDAGDVLLGYGTDIESVMEMGFWVPQRDTAYQPRVQPWD